MFRALLRRIPRFGFVTLFALMLLFVSAAGWLKFHLDLWREEEILLADLTKAGVEHSYVRHSGQIVEKWSRATPQTPAFWDPLVPYVSRIDRIILRNPAPRELHERAARLPYSRMIYSEGRTTTLGADTIAAKVGLEVPNLNAPSIPGELAPLPRGEAIDGESVSFGKKFLDAWASRQTVPEKGTATVVDTGTPVREFVAWDENLRFDAMDVGFFAIETPKSCHSFAWSADGFREETRLDDWELASGNFERSTGRLIHFFPREVLRLDLERLGIEERFLAALREGDGVRVERIDETRTRIDLALVIAYPVADCKDVYAISMIARTDLDWEVEAWDIVSSRTAGPSTPKTVPPTANASYRGTLRRERDWVVTEEWAADWIAGSPSTVAGYPPSVFSSRYAGAAKYDFSPDLDLSHVTPEAFDARLLPLQRELPWLPWHRATFALSLGLLAFVGVRRFWNRSNTASGGRPSPEVPGVAFDSPSGD